MSSANDTISVVVCEDEPLAREHLHELITAAPQLRCVGEAADGVSAVAVIDAVRPVLVFLDIRMPELDGLAVLARIAHQPAVVFTTAYDAHAVQAFELGAVDYLLKHLWCGAIHGHRVASHSASRGTRVRGRAGRDSAAEGGAAARAPVRTRGQPDRADRRA